MYSALVRAWVRRNRATGAACRRKRRWGGRIHAANRAIRFPCAEDPDRLDSAVPPSEAGSALGVTAEDLGSGQLPGSSRIVGRAIGGPIRSGASGGSRLLRGGDRKPTTPASRVHTTPLTRGRHAHRLISSHGGWAGRHPHRPRELPVASRGLSFSLTGRTRPLRSADRLTPARTRAPERERSGRHVRRRERPGGRARWAPAERNASRSRTKRPLTGRRTVAMLAGSQPRATGTPPRRRYRLAAANRGAVFRACAPRYRGGARSGAGCQPA